MFNRLNIATKVTLAFSLLIFASVMLVGFLVFSGSNRLIIESSEKRLEHTAQIIAIRTQTYLQGITDDLAFLVRNPLFKALVRASENGIEDPETGFSYSYLENQLSEIFSSLLESRNTFFQVRLIGLADDGREIIRIDQRNDTIVKTEQKLLQEKGSREYFQETIKMEDGEIYLSDINLNQEFGRINIPIIPTIRVATPVYGEKGNLFGIIVINIELFELFKTMQNLADPGMLVYLTNQDGDYLLHPDPNRMFGFEMGKNFNIQKEFPSGKEIVEGNTDRLQTEENEIETNEPHLLHLQKLQVYNDQRFLVLGVASPLEALLSESNQIHLKSILITLFVSVVGLALTWFFGRTLIRPLSTITSAIENFGKGDRNKIKQIHRKDEIGVLARSFNSMADQIQDQMENLAEKEENIRSIIDSTQEAILIFDQQFKIKKVNPAAAKMFSIPAEDLTGKTLNELIQPAQTFKWPETNQEHNEFFQRFNQGYETTITLRNGSKLHVFVSISSFLAKGIINYTAVLHDISARKKYETELLEAKKSAEAASKIKDEFLSVMSHEIRTPLNGVIGMSRLLHQNNDDPKLRPIIETLQFSAGNLLSLINDILDFSKIQAGKVQLEKTLVNLHALLKNVNQSHLTDAMEKRLELNLQLGEQLPEYIISDQVRLYQVVNNLVSNAIKFTEKGGVYIQAIQDQEGLLRISVRDTGIGIPADRLDRIFEYFTQASSDTTRKYGGSGLGLTITSNLVDLMQGKVEVESTPGQGSVFTVILPIALPENLPVRESKPTPETKKVKPARILYLEDVSYNQFIVENFLEITGLQIDCASSGVEGLAMFRENHYDLVLMDLNMPGMDGFEATSKIKEISPETPVVAVTAMVSEQVKEKMAAAGMSDLVTKPVDPDKLIETISRQLDNKEVQQVKLQEFNAIYDHDEKKIGKALNLLLQEMQKINQKLNLLESHPNIDLLKEIQHRLKPHLNLLGLEQIEEELSSLKSELTSAETQQVRNRVQKINRLFRRLIVDINSRLESRTKVS